MKKFKIFSLATAVALVTTVTGALMPFTVMADTKVFDTAPYIQDTFVENLAADPIQQGSKTLYARAFPNEAASDTRIIYMKLDCTELLGTEITNASLRLYHIIHTASEVHSMESGTLTVHSFPNADWDVATTKWANRPDETGIEQVGTIEIDGYDKAFTIDLTQVIDEDEDKIISLKILGDPLSGASVGGTGGPGRYMFASMEHDVVANRPSLTVEYTAGSLVGGIILDKQSLSLYNDASQATKINATIAPPSAINKVLEWTSSDPAVATVDGDGMVTPVGAGVTTITAKSTDGSNKEATCQVTVLPIDGSDTIPIEYDLFVHAGGMDSYTDTFLRLRGAGGQARDAYLRTDSSEIIGDKNVVWAGLYLYAFPGPANVATNGGILPVYGLSRSDFIQPELKYADVPTPPPVQTTFNPVVIGAQDAGGFDRFYVVDITEYVKEKTDGDLAFKISGDDSIANVPGELYFKSIDEPQEELRPYLKVFYKNPDVVVTGIEINKTELRLPVGLSDKLTATVLPEDADDQRVRWSSSDETVATVDANGKVTAIADGTAKITVESLSNNAVKAECDVTVTGTTGTIAAVADGFIVEGDKAAYNEGNGNHSNYHTIDFLYARDDVVSGVGATQERITFLKFDMSSLTENADKYILSLYRYNDIPTAQARGDAMLPVYYVDWNNWSEDYADLETKLSWNRAFAAMPQFPQGGATLAGHLDAKFEEYDVELQLDVTDIVKADQDGIITFVLKGNPERDERFIFKSREADGGQYAPHLRWISDPGLVDDRVVASYEYKDGDGVAADSWTTGGSVDVTAELKNSIFDIGTEKSIMVFALYEKAGKKRMVSTAVSAITDIATEDETTTFEATLENLPGNENDYTKKIFIWSPWDGQPIMQPYFP